REIPKYVQNLGDFFSDRVGAKAAYLRPYQVVRYLIHDSPSEKVVIGKKGFLFYAGDNDPISDARNERLYSDAELKAVVDYYAALSAAFQRRGAHYILMIAPNKHSVYPELLPYYVTKVNDHSALDQLLSALSEVGVDALDLREPLRAA